MDLALRGTVPPRVVDDGSRNNGEQDADDHRGGDPRKAGLRWSRGDRLGMPLGIEPLQRNAQNPKSESFRSSIQPAP
jgi:hypothetical protein